MTQDRSLRRVLQLGTSLALVLGLAACVSAPDSFQTTQAPEAADTHPDRVAYYCKKLHEQGDHYVAIDICKRAFELDQTNTDPLHRLGDIMARAGAYDKAA